MFKFLTYHLAVTMNDMMVEVDKHEDLIPKVDGEGEYAGCKVWVSPKGPKVVRRSDGMATYSLYDLVFANDAHDLARRLVNSYHAEFIKDGRIGFKIAVFTHSLV